jgi:hypothetical protein
MTEDEFERILKMTCDALSKEAKNNKFSSSALFEKKVREKLNELTQAYPGIEIDFNPNPQAFPDIAVGKFGVEVKFTLNNTWRSVANSVLETNRIATVEKVYLIFGKMGGDPEVKWGDYEKSVIHVRTSHVPRFEVEISAEHSLFEMMGIRYDDFRKLRMEEKMHYIRKYAKDRLKEGERLWWLEDNIEAEHSIPIQARLYTKLPKEEQTRLRAEAVLLCPSIVKSGRSKNKYDDAVLYLLTYHGVICHQARDLFSAGSVANPKKDDKGGIYIERALKLIKKEIKQASLEMDDALFIEYWGESVPPEQRIKKWLEKADALAKNWKPSESLSLEE